MIRMVDSSERPDDDHCQRLLRRTLITIVGCAVLVAFCYYFVDRPVALFVHRHEIPRVEEFRWLTEPPPLVQSWSPLVLIALAVRRAFGPWRRWQHVLFLACVSLIVADQFRESLGDLCGRYWPETWRDNNPSLHRHRGVRVSPVPSRRRYREFSVWPRDADFGLCCRALVGATARAMAICDRRGADARRAGSDELPFCRRCDRWRSSWCDRG